MLTAQEARDFIRNHSAKEIFQRAVLYEVEMSLNHRDHPCGSLLLLVTVATFAGKFAPEKLEDPQIKKLIDMTDWGQEYNTNQLIDSWLGKVAKDYNDLRYMREMYQALESKFDDIDLYFQENAKAERMPSDYYNWPIV